MDVLLSWFRQRSGSRWIGRRRSCGLGAPPSSGCSFSCAWLFQPRWQWPPPARRSCSRMRHRWARSSPRHPTRRQQRRRSRRSAMANRVSPDTARRKREGRASRSEEATEAGGRPTRVATTSRRASKHQRPVPASVLRRGRLPDGFNAFLSAPVARVADDGIDRGVLVLAGLLLAVVTLGGGCLTLAVGRVARSDEMKALGIGVSLVLAVLAWPATALALDGPAPSCNGGSCVGWFTGVGEPVAVSWSAPAGASLTDCQFQTITTDTSGTNVSCGAYYAAQQQTVTATVTARRDTTPRGDRDLGGPRPRRQRVVQPRRRGDPRGIGLDLGDRVLRRAHLLRPGLRGPPSSPVSVATGRATRVLRRRSRSSTTRRLRRRVRRSPERRTRTAGTPSPSASRSAAATRRRGSRRAPPRRRTQDRTPARRAPPGSARIGRKTTRMRRRRSSSTRRPRRQSPSRRGRPTGTVGTRSR